MNSGNEIELAEWAETLEIDIAQLQKEWEDLRRRRLISVRAGKVSLSPLAMRRATNDTQRRLAVFLAGLVSTESSYIVRRPGEPPGKTFILNTRIAVEHIANYFEGGWGVSEIQKDLPLLTRDEIEAAIQYYLNHRDESRREMAESVEIYDSHTSRALARA